MENTIKPQKRISQRIAELLFTLYMITLYIFVDREETVMISKIVFVIFAIFTVIAVFRDKNIHIGKNVMTVYIAFTWMFATVFWAKNTHDATVTMKTMWQLFIQFFLTYNLFVKQSNAHEYLLKSLYIAGIVLLGYSIYVYGFSEVINMMTEESAVRLGRKINQENTYGMLNAMTVLIAFHYLIYRKNFKFFHLAMIVISFVFAMSSGSRKAFLMVLVGVLIMVYKKYGWRRLYKIFLVATILLALFSVIISLPMFETITERMETFGELITGDGLGDDSSVIRKDMIIDGWEVFKDRLIIGYGANNYKNVTRYNVYSHNNFIEILVNFGLLGFCLYYFIYLICFKCLRNAQSDEAKTLFSIFIVRFMMEIAMVPYYDKVHWVIIAFCLISAKENELSVHSAEGETETIPAVSVNRGE